MDNYIPLELQVELLKAALSKLADPNLSRHTTRHTIQQIARDALLASDGIFV